MGAYKQEGYAAFIGRQLTEDIQLRDKVLSALPHLRPPQPTIEELAAYKDRMRIPDAEWHYTVDTFGLREYATLARVRRQRHIENGILPTAPTPGGTGYEIPLLEYLQSYLRAHPPPASDKPILIKFALNGATMTTGKRGAQELGGFQVLTPGESLSSTKSPRNCHMFIIYIGTETEEELREELAEAIKVHCIL